VSQAFIYTSRTTFLVIEPKRLMDETKDTDFVWCFFGVMV
jgi:hypothetical protein